MSQSDGALKHEGHQAHEERHEGLPVETERVMTQTIGCALSVHRALGPGFLESIYQRAMCIELSLRGLPFEAERGVAVYYRGISIPGQRIDLIVADAVVVELKCVDRFDAIHVQQVVSYLKTTGLRAGLLLNFKVPLLKQGIRRVLL